VTSILSLVVAFIIFYEIFMREVLVKPTVWVAEGTVFGLRGCSISWAGPGP